MEKMALLPSFIKFEDLKRKWKRLNRLFLFVTTCMYTENRSKTITCQHIDENAFLAPYFWNEPHWIDREGTMHCSLKGLPSTETAALSTPVLKNCLKFVAQQNQDACMPHICFAVLLDSRLDFKSRTTIRIGTTINLSSFFQQHLYFESIFDASQVTYEKSITAYTFGHSTSVVFSTVRGKTKLIDKY